jgi:hypothetical protein
MDEESKKLRERLNKVAKQFKPNAKVSVNWHPESQLLTLSGPAASYDEHAGDPATAAVQAEYNRWLEELAASVKLCS